MASPNSNLESVIVEYLEFCEIDKNLTQSTIRMYHMYLMDFNEWASSFLNKEQVKIKDIDSDLVKKYRIYLNRRKSQKFNKEFKRTTQKTFLVALRAFLKYLVVEQNLDVMSPDQIILGKSEDRVPKVLNEEQLKRLFDVQDLGKRSGLRDRAMLEVLFSTGLRVSELVGLNMDSIDPNSNEFTVVGKGRKARVVYLSPSARKWLDKYVKTRNDSYKPLFIRYSGKLMEEGDFDGESLRLTPRSVQRMVKKYTTRAGITVDATPHTLRHSFATGLIREGANLREVQDMLGHSNLSTTQIYTHVTDARLKDVHKMFHKDVETKSDIDDVDEDIGKTSDSKIDSLI
jgi:site-specific recombinase XerD